jgi:DNA-binding NtrC family response regulator
MGLNMQIKEANNTVTTFFNFIPNIVPEARILIVCDDDSLSGQLEHFFREAEFTTERVRTMTAGCTAARSGRFQAVFAAPVLSDGSWKRLIDLANNLDLGYVVVLVASNFDLNQWAEALKDGAFDVLDVLHELPQAAEVAQRASWAAYLKGGGPCSEAGSPCMAA